jgi:uncharacterized protein YehS (DUF1456 family)
MLNSDILRRIRYAFNFDDKLMLEIFKLGGIELDVDSLRNHLKKEEDEGYMPLGSRSLISFLDGLIIRKRGPRENPPAARPVKESFSNNLVLRKIKIALGFKEEDLLAVLKRSEMEISRSELSALFRQKDHKNYKVCGDQLLRNFLAGLAGYKRPLPVSPPKETLGREESKNKEESQRKHESRPKRLVADK